MRLRHLTLTAALGCAALAAPAAAQANEPPQVSISCLKTAYEVGEQVSCETDFAFDVDGEIVALEWDADGDGFDDGTGSELSGSFGVPGIYDVRLRATDDGGATAIGSVELEIYELGDGPAFAASADRVVPGTSVTFTAPFGPGEADGSTAYERRWDFDGDGTWDDSGTLNRVATAWFDEAGTYTVRLRTQAFDGGAATVATKTIVVEPEILPPSHPGGGSGGSGGSGGGSTRGPGTPTPTTRAVTFTGTAGAVAKAPVLGGGPAQPAKPAAKKQPAAKKAKCKVAKAKKGKKKAKTCKAKPKKKAARKKG